MVTWILQLYEAVVNESHSNFSKYRFFSNNWIERFTTWKVSVFKVFLVCIFPYSDWIMVNNFYCVICCFKYEQRYDMQSKMSEHSDFQSFTGKLFSLWLRGEKSKIPDSKIEAKLNLYEFPCASSLTKCLENFEKMTGFWKSFCPFISKSLHTHCSPSQNVSPLLLLNCLLMVTNEESRACN